jgi:hypothetical protein
MMQFILLSLVAYPLCASQTPPSTMQRALSAGLLSTTPTSPPIPIPDSPFLKRRETVVKKVYPKNAGRKATEEKLSEMFELDL